MEIKELNKLVDHELQWLKYYALEESRKKLTTDSNIYQDLKSIGYTKRVISLDKRCAAGAITSKTNTPLSEYSVLEDLESIKEYRNPEENKFTPLEVLWVLFPEQRVWVIQQLNS